MKRAAFSQGGQHDDRSKTVLSRSRRRSGRPARAHLLPISAAALMMSACAVVPAANDGGSSTSPAAGSPAAAATPAAAPAPATPAIAMPPAAVGASRTETVPGGPIVPSGDGTGNFRVLCRFSHTNFDDAIVYPGQPGRAHMHTYFGNTGSNAMSTAESLATTGNSTCDGGTANRSSYWVPSLLDAGGNVVVPTFNRVYYKSGYHGLRPDEISPTLPVGLRMIAGDAKATSSQAPTEVRKVHWNCVYNKTEQTELSPFIPYCAPGSELKAVVEYPQCWDGVNLDSPDHKSHMAFGGFSKKCPATHPVALPEITFNIHWPVGPSGTSGWRLSSDMYPVSESQPGGYSLHGDVFLAWDPAVSSMWLENCVRQAVDCSVGLIDDNVRLVPAVG